MKDETARNLLLITIIALGIGIMFFMYSSALTYKELQLYKTENRLDYKNNTYNFNQGEILYFSLDGEVYYTIAEEDKCFYIKNDKFYYDYSQNIGDYEK